MRQRPTVSPKELEEVRKHASIQRILQKKAGGGPSAQHNTSKESVPATPVQNVNSNFKRVMRHTPIGIEQLQNRQRNQ